MTKHELKRELCHHDQSHGLSGKLETVVAWATIGCFFVAAYRGIDLVHMVQVGMLLLILFHLWGNEE